MSATLQTIDGPTTIAKGTTVKITVGTTNTDVSHQIVGVDENGNRVTFTYGIHTNLTFSCVPVAAALATGAKAPAGTMVFWTDDTAGGLSVDPANPLGLQLAV